MSEQSCHLCSNELTTAYHMGDGPSMCHTGAESVNDCPKCALNLTNYVTASNELARLREEVERITAERDEAREDFKAISEEDEKHVQLGLAWKEDADAYKALAREAAGLLRKISMDGDPGDHWDAIEAFLDAHPELAE